MHARKLSIFLLTCKHRLQVHALAGPDYLVLGYVLEVLQVLWWSVMGGRPSSHLSPIWQY